MGGGRGQRRGVVGPVLVVEALKLVRLDKLAKDTAQVWGVM